VVNWKALAYGFWYACCVVGFPNPQGVFSLINFGFLWSCASEAQCRCDLYGWCGPNPLTGNNILTPILWAEIILVSQSSLLYSYYHYFTIGSRACNHFIHEHEFLVERLIYIHWCTLSLIEIQIIQYTWYIIQ
jgi:hypothetical protein